MKLLIFGGGLSPLNMERVKRGGVLKYAGGFMGEDYGVVFKKDGRAFLSICLSQWVMVLVSSSGMIGGLGMTPLKSSIMSYTSVQMTRMPVFLKFCAIWRREMIKFGT